MALRGPKNAIPTSRGWVHLRTGELLKSAKLTSAQIQEWHGVTPYESEPEPVVQTLHEAPVPEKALSEEEIQYHYAKEDTVDHEEE